MRLVRGELQLLVATFFLGLVALMPWTPENVRYVALGALAGIVGGHLNGRMAKDGHSSSSDVASS